MKPAQCSSYFMQSCFDNSHQDKDYCPTHNHPDIYIEAKKIYAEDSETDLLAKNAAVIESKGYMM